MGKVAQYQQREFASSLVGTPGVDNSGAMLASALGQAQATNANMLAQSNAQDTAQTQAMLNNFAGNLGQQLGHSQRVYQQAQMAQQKLNQDSAIADAGQDLAKQVADLEAKVQKDYASDPKKGMQFYEDGMQSIKEGWLSSDKLPSDYARLAFNKDFGTKSDSSYKAMKNWQTSQETAVGGNMLFTNAKTLNDMAENTSIGDVAALQRFNKEFIQTNKEKSDMFNGAHSEKYLSDTTSNATHNALLKWSMQEPGSVRRLYDAGKLLGLLPANEMHTILAQDATNVTAAEHAHKESVAKSDMNIHDWLQDTALDTRIYAATDPQRASSSIRYMIDSYNSLRQRPEAQRDRTLEKEHIEKIASALAINDALKRDMVSEMQATAQYNRESKVQEILDALKQQSADKEATHDRLSSAEAINLKQSVNADVDSWRNRFIAADGNPDKAGVSAQEIRATQKKLSDGFHQGIVSKDDYLTLTKSIRGASDSLYGKQTDNIFSMFVNQAAAGPDDHLLRLMGGIKKFDAQGNKTPEYNQIATDVNKRLEKNIADQRLPKGVQLSNEQKNRLFRQAEFDTFLDYIGVNQQVSEPAKTKAPPVQSVPPINRNQVRQQATQMFGRQAKTKSGFVAPPPPTATGRYTRADVAEQRRILQAQLAGLDNIETVD